MISPSAILERFMHSDAGKQLAAEYATDRLNERRGLAAEIEKLEASWLQERARLDAEEKTAADYVAQLRDVLAKAEAEHARARGARHVASIRHGAAVSRLEAKLRSTADARLDAFLREMRDLADKTSQQLQSIEPKYSDEPTPWGRKPHYSNAASVNARLAAIRSAMAEAEALKLVALDDDELAAKLEALRRSLPPVGPTVPVGAA